MINMRSAYTKVVTVIARNCLVICSASRDLVPFAQFKKCEKHSWNSVNVSKVAGLECQF